MEVAVWIGAVGVVVIALVVIYLVVMLGQAAGDRHDIWVELSVLKREELPEHFERLERAEKMSPALWDYYLGMRLEKRFERLERELESHFKSLEHEIRTQAHETRMWPKEPQ